MKDLKSLKGDLFGKELTKAELKTIKGNGGGASIANDTGTHPTSTYDAKGKYTGQDCGDNSPVD